MFSEYEIYSLEDVANEFGFKIDDPLLYAIYLNRNPELGQEEKDYYVSIMNKAIRRQTTLNKRNAEKLKDARLLHLEKVEQNTIKQLPP